MASLPVSAAEYMAGGGETDLHLTASQESARLDAGELMDTAMNTQPIEVYMHYAAIERARELADTRPVPDSDWTILFKTLTGKRSAIVRPPKPGSSTDSVKSEKRGWLKRNKGRALDEKLDDHPHEVTVTAPDDPELAALDVSGEKETAYRLLRIASWQTVFYLITTDILGFSSAPEAFGQLGYGPGILIYTIFFILAFLGGQILWRMYLHLDSERFPVTCYADLAERTYGRPVRHVFNILQSLQLIFNVALLIIGNGQTLVTIIDYKFCYIALNVFWAIAGMIGGQLKSLRSFAWFTNVNIWLNIVVMAITMAGTAIYPPVPSQSNHKDLSEPINRSGWVPSYTIGWYQQVSGAQFAVFAYGGAMIFTEFMAEMRRPKDFWKAAFFAQLFCWIMYMFFGLFCYSYQGQYVSILPSLNFDNTKLQLACNIIGLFSTGVACVLYANIGVKVFYHNVLRTYFRFPSFTTRKGSVVWSITVVVYWAVAWIIGCAIPNINALVTIIGAACILQFSYTFPPLLLLGHWMQIDAAKADEPWEPGMAPFSNRIDSWRDATRWKRGFRKYWYVKVFLILLVLGALSLAGLGIYSGIETAMEAYRTNSATAFSCDAPSQG